MTETKETVKLQDNLIFATTIYDSFEALEEALGKLKLEQSLFLVYLAKKSFAEAVFNAAEEIGITSDKPSISMIPPSQIRMDQSYMTQLH